MMANECYCKIYLSKIFYLEEFCPFLQRLYVKAGNCTNPNLSQ